MIHSLRRCVMEMVRDRGIVTTDDCWEIIMSSQEP